MQIFDTFECSGQKYGKLLMSILKQQVNSSSNFVSFFIVMTDNSSVIFKLMHFVLWIKGSHQSPNFETFKHFGNNLPNSSSHFLNHKSVFLQILHHSSVPWKITPLGFFRSNVTYFAQKEPKWKFWEFWVLRSKFNKSLYFWNNKSVFLQILHQSSWDINPLFFFSWTFIYLQQREPIKIQIWWNFIEQSKFDILHFDGFLLSKSYKVSARVMQSLKKKVIFHDTKQWRKI